MIQLTVLNGNEAGARRVARRFPFQVGRSPNSDLRLEDPGVWDRHLRIEVRPHDGVVLFADAAAFTAINSHPIQEAILRNGDVIEIGSVRLLFGLSPTTQYSLRFREAATWIALGALGFVQVALIYWMTMN